MSPRTAEQFEEIRTTKKRVILEAALEVFAAEGYHSASISKVSKKAGVSKGLMYNYFESKEDLLHQLLNEIILKETAIMQFINKEDFTDESMIALLDHTVNLLKSDPQHWKLYFIMSIQAEIMQILMADHKALYADFYGKYITYFTKKGHSNPLQTIQYFGATFSGIKMNYVLDPDNFPIDEMKDLLIKQFIK